MNMPTNQRTSSEDDTTLGHNTNALSKHLTRILSGAFLILVPFFLGLYLLGARAPLSKPQEDPRLVALKRDPIAVSMVKWLRDEVETNLKISPDRIGCYRENGQGNCVLTFYDRTVFVKVWIDQGGAHWKPLPGLRA